MIHVKSYFLVLRLNGTADFSPFSVVFGTIHVPASL